MCKIVVDYELFHKYSLSLQTKKILSIMMHDLFDNNYLGYKFPEPQYLGAKFIHRGWIAKFIPESVRCFWGISVGSIYDEAAGEKDTYQ